METTNVDVGPMLSPDLSYLVRGPSGGEQIFCAEHLRREREERDRLNAPEPVLLGRTFAASVCQRCIRQAPPRSHGSNWSGARRVLLVGMWVAVLAWHGWFRIVLEFVAVVALVSLAVSGSIAVALVAVITYRAIRPRPEKAAVPVPEKLADAVPQWFAEVTELQAAHGILRSGSWTDRRVSDSERS
jgi:hypothetical protein